MSKHSLERVYRIWDDVSGDYIQISEDDDGLGLMKISTVMTMGPKENDKEVNSVFIDPESFDIFLEAVTDYIENRRLANDSHT